MAGTFDFWSKFFEVLWLVVGRQHNNCVHVTCCILQSPKDLQRWYRNKLGKAGKAHADFALSDAFLGSVSRIFLQLLPGVAKRVAPCARIEMPDLAAVLKHHLARENVSTKDLVYEAMGEMWGDKNFKHKVPEKWRPSSCVTSDHAERVFTVCVMTLRLMEITNMTREDLCIGKKQKLMLDRLVALGIRLTRIAKGEYSSPPAFQKIQQWANFICELTATDWDNRRQQFMKIESWSELQKLCVVNRRDSQQQRSIAVGASSSATSSTYQFKPGRLKNIYDPHEERFCDVFLKQGMRAFLNLPCVRQVNNRHKPFLIRRIKNMASNRENIGPVPSEYKKHKEHKEHKERKERKEHTEHKEYKEYKEYKHTEDPVNVSNPSRCPSLDPSTNSPSLGPSTNPSSEICRQRRVRKRTWGHIGNATESSPTSTCAPKKLKFEEMELSTIESTSPASENSETWESPHFQSVDDPSVPAAISLSLPSSFSQDSHAASSPMTAQAASKDHAASLLDPELEELFDENS